MKRNPDKYGRRGIKTAFGKTSGKRFIVGDKVPIPNGMYIGYEGGFVISGGRLIHVSKRIYDRWGMTLRLDDIMEKRGPLGKSYKEVKR